LREQNWTWPIETVHKFSTPAETEAVAEDEALGIDHRCNVLELVDVCSNPACFDFCIDFDVIENLGVVDSTEGNDAFFSYPMTGGFTWKIPGTSFGICADVVFVPFTNTADFFYPAITGNEPTLSGEANFIASSYYFTGGITPCEIITPGETTTSIGVLGISGPGDLVYGAYPATTPDIITFGPPGIIISGDAVIALKDYFYVGGVWPFIDFAAPQTIATAGELPFQGWLNVGATNGIDNVFATSNLSFLKTSQDIVATNFQIISLNTQLPTGKQISNDFRILGIQLVINRKAALTVRDSQVFFIFQDSDVSSNLAKISVSWPTVNTGTIYGDTLTLSLDEAFSDPDLSTSSLFGVRLRAQGFDNSGGTLASVDGFNLIYRYEDAVGNNQTVRMGGTARQITEHYFFVPSGGIPMGGTADVKRVTFAVTADPTGLFPPDFASLFFFGGASIHFRYVAITEEIIMSGEAGVKSSDIQYVAVTGDGIILESNNNLVASDWTALITGGAIIEPTDVTIPAILSTMFHNYPFVLIIPIISYFCCLVMNF